MKALRVHTNKFYDVEKKKSEEYFNIKLWIKNFWVLLFHQYMKEVVLQISRSDLLLYLLYLIRDIKGDIYQIMFVAIAMLHARNIY